MQIKRVYKDISLKAGQEEVIDETQMKKVYDHCDLYINNALVAQSGHGQSFSQLLDRLRNGEIVHQFFSTFQMVTE